MARIPQLPSDKLKAPRRPWRLVAIVAATLVVLAGVFGISRVIVAGYANDDVRVSGSAHEKPQISHKLLVPHTAKSLVPPPPPEPVYVAPPSGGGGGGGGPVRCPAGSTVNSNDGQNDTSCFWNVCFTITLPDPSHPECDSAFRP